MSHVLQYSSHPKVKDPKFESVHDRNLTGTIAL